MGTSTDAILAYGYDLGAADNWNIHDLGEYGELPVDWYDEDAGDFIAQAERRLLERIAGFTEQWAPNNNYWDRQRAAKARLGVEFDTYCSDSYPMHVLAAKVITVARGDTELLDLPALTAEPAAHGWDAKLAAALQALGITPTQERPGWILCSYYGG